MSVLDINTPSVIPVNPGSTEESLKSIGFFRAAYDIDVKIAIHEYIKVPSYLKFIPLDNNMYSNGGFVSIRYIPYIEELTINTNTFITPDERLVETYKHINDIDEINILVHQYIKNIKRDH